MQISQSKKKYVGLLGAVIVLVSLVLALAIKQGILRVTPLTGVVTGGGSNTKWQNGPRHKDVNNDGVANKVDADALKAYLDNSSTKKVYTSNYTPNPRYPDVNGDNSVSPVDLLIIVNYLNNPANPKPEGESSQYLWYNSKLAADVNNDTVVNQRDVDELKAYIDNQSTPKYYNASYKPSPRFPDVSNDKYVTPVDLLRVINWINSH